VKDCGENVSELMIGGGGQLQETIRSTLLGVFTFCSCILICLECIVASFKLSCVIVVGWPCVLL